MDSNKIVTDVYNSIATKYDKKRHDPKDSSWNVYLEEPAIETLLKPLVENKAVLDLGCGTGILTDKLYRWNAQPQGIDQSEKMIEIGRRSFPYLTFHVGCANDLPYRDGEFDVVASSLMMHYIKNLVPVFHEFDDFDFTSKYPTFCVFHAVKL